MVLKFYHNSDKAQPIYITGDVEYEISKAVAEPRETIILTVHNWSNEFFEMKIGSSDVFIFGFSVEIKNKQNSRIGDHEIRKTEEGYDLELTDKATMANNINIKGIKKLPNKINSKIIIMTAITV